MLEVDAGLAFNDSKVFVTAFINLRLDLLSFVNSVAKRRGLFQKVAQFFVRQSGNKRSNFDYFVSVNRSTCYQNVT